MEFSSVVIGTNGGAKWKYSSGTLVISTGVDDKMAGCIDAQISTPGEYSRYNTSDKDAGCGD
jgi:hypothetical protein